MLVCRTFNQLRDYLDQQTQIGNSIGFVPTMGALHKGHLSLLAESRKLCDITVCSIFVNPTQFNNSEDLEKYPRPVNADLKKLEDVNCDVAFLPDVDEVYPTGYVSEPIDLAGLDLVMEGAHRPGHFDGVVQVVGRFFEQINPTKAFFGEKDFQQLAVLKRMVAVNNADIEIIPCAILREESGLAMSSRNVRLSDKGQAQAVFISEQLNWAKQEFSKQSLSSIVKEVTLQFSKRKEFDLEYFEIAEIDMLQPVSSTQQKARAFIAAHLEGVRLIDNIALNY